MHFLTKFLVIIAAVLSVLLAGLSVGMAVNANAVAEQNRAINSQLAAAQATVTDREAQAIAQAELLRTELDERLAQRSEAQLELEGLRAEMSRISQQLIEARQDQVSSEAERVGVMRMIETLQRIDEIRDQEVRELREDKVEDQFELIALSDRINELASQLEVAEETTRRLQEELIQTRERSEFAEAGNGPRPGIRTPPQNFRGQVTGVTDNPAGGLLVAINGGSQDRLAPRMELRVRRGNTFVATIVVRDVNLNDAVGVIDVEGPGSPVRPGDVVDAVPR